MMRMPLVATDTVLYRVLQSFSGLWAEKARFMSPLVNCDIIQIMPVLIAADF